MHKCGAIYVSENIICCQMMQIVIKTNLMKFYASLYIYILLFISNLLVFIHKNKKNDLFIIYTNCINIEIMLVHMK